MRAETINCAPQVPLRRPTGRESPRGRGRVELLFVAFAAGWLWSCVGCTLAPPPSPPDTFALAADLSTMMTLDPAAIAESLTSGIMRNVCDSLLVADESDASVVEAGLADNWSASDDLKTYTFHIRPGLRFPSGNPVTAHDVAWSIRRSLTLNQATAKRLREWGFSAKTIDKAVTAVDDATLVVKLSQPFAPSLFQYAFSDYRLASALDSKTILEHQVGDDLGAAWLARNTACYGPFRIKTWRSQEVLIMERNDGWWRYDSPIRRVILRHIPEAGAQRLMLEKGDVDYALQIDPADYEALETNPDVYFQRTPTMRTVYMAFNAAEPLFADPKVTRAMRYLIDYQALADTVLENAAVVCQCPVPQGMFGALDADYQPFRLDPEEARRLLTEAGHPEGIEFELLVQGSFPYADIAQNLQQTAQLAGVTVHVQSLSGKQLFAILRERKFSASLSGYSFNYPDANNVMLRQGYNPEGDPTDNTGSIAWRSSWYPGRWFDTTVLAAQTERDVEKRRAMYRELQLYHMENSPIANLFQRVGVRIFHRNVISARANALGLSFASVVKRGNP